MSVLNTKEIMEIIPHRHPFLLVDTIEELEAGVRAVGKKCVTYDEYYFRGHFPNEPVMPGVLIIEALAQVGAFRHLHPRLSVLLNTVSDYTIFLLLRQQKVYLHPLPKWQADHTSHFEDVRHVLSPSETTLYAFLLL